jgi:hypothetical protein
MKAATARAYLDDMPIAEFATTVVPFLDPRTGDGCIRYTRDSIDDRAGCTGASHDGQFGASARRWRWCCSDGRR